MTANGTPGSSITATATFTNNGPSTAQNVTATIVVPSGATQTVVIGSLNAGASTVTVVTYSVPNGSTTVQNWTAGVATSTAESTLANNTVTAATPLTALADVSTTLSVTANGTPGSSITATATFTNNGPSTAQNVTATIIKPTARPAPVPIGSLASGGSTRDGGDVQGAGRLHHGSELDRGVATTTPESTTANNTVTAVTTLAALADVSTTLSVTPAATPGSSITATATFSNNGPSTAQNVVGTIVLPSGTTQTVVIGSLNAGASTVTVVSYSVPNGSTNDQIWTAGVATSTPESTLANNTATAVTTLNVPIVLADLVVKKVSSSTVAMQGSVIFYTVTLVNLGPSVAQNITLTDTLGEGLALYGVPAVIGGGLLSSSPSGAIASVSSLPVGGSLTLIVQALVTASTPNLTNSAFGTSTTPDPVPGNNRATVGVPLMESADLLVTKAAGVARAAQGQTISYTVTLVNLGPNEASNVVLTDVLGAGLTLVGASSNSGTTTAPGASVATGAPTLAVGGTLTLAVQALVTASSGNVTNAATGVSTTYDPVSTNNAATVTVLVRTTADLSISKVASVAVGTVGQTFTYAIEFGNAGPSTAQNVTVTDRMPLGLSLKRAVSDIGTVVSTGGGMTLTLASLAPGARGLITLTVMVTGGSGSITNVAGVTSTTADPVSSNNTATSTISRNAGADLSITKAASVTSGTVGSTFSYVIAFANTGPSTADNVTVTDNLTAAGLTLLSAQASSGTLSTSSTALTLTLANMDGTSNGTITLTVQVNSGAGSITNAVGITSTTADPTPRNNTATSTISRIDSVDIAVTLLVPPSAAPGTTVQATVTFTNNGPSLAQFVTGTLTLPNGSSTVVFTATAMPAGSTSVVIVPYVVSSSQSVGLNWTATVATTTPEVQLSNNVAIKATGLTVVTNASVSGYAWYDINRNRIFDAPPVDQPLTGFRVELLKGTTVVGSATTAVNGSYQIGGQVPGPGYSLRFLDPTGKQVYGTPFNQSAQTLLANPSTGTGSLTSPVSPDQLIAPVGVISNVTLYAGDNVIQQNLPVDPNGVVYDSVTRQPIAGAVVTLNGPAGFDPGVHLIGGSNVSTTQPGGFYQFLLNSTAPSGVYTLQVAPPAGYGAGPATQGGVALPGSLNPVPAGVVNVQPQSTAPAVGVNGAATQYYLQFGFVFPTSGQVFNNHIPLDPLAVGAILVNKVGNKTIAEIGDSVQYTIRLRNTSSGPIANVVLEDLLPAGFRYIPGTARLNTGSGTSTVADPVGSDGRQLNFVIGSMPPAAAPELTYFVRVGAGSQAGDGINRATAVFPGPGGTSVRSNTALFKVIVQGGVFTNQGCIIGKVYVDCDGNAVQNNTSGSRDLGIPGVRLVLLDGTYVITDVEGKYSLCGIKSQTQVIKVDRSTLPAGSRLVPSSNRNAGVGDSLFIDMRGGEMARADFIEGSCSPGVMDQVKARRGQGMVIVPAAPVMVLPGAQGVQR